MMRATVHALKTWPEFYGAISAKRKRFEIRQNDRGFAVGDYLRLREWNRHTERYTGRECLAEVTFVTAFGLVDGMVCMSIELRDANSMW